MRDLEFEQGGKSAKELDALLGDIEDHATRLPERPELQKLRETALTFVKDVRASGARRGHVRCRRRPWPSFGGTHAHEQARQASEILARFVKRCQGEGDMASECQGALVFQPKLCQGLGNTR